MTCGGRMHTVLRPVGWWRRLYGVVEHRLKRHQNRIELVRQFGNDFTPMIDLADPIVGDHTAL